MYAVIKTGGKQYRVQAGDVLVVEKLDGEPGAKVAFDQVLAIGEGEAVTLGAPLVDGATVSATLIETRRGEKIKVFKKIRRQGYRRTQGHRQSETVLRVTGLAGAGQSETWDGEVDLTPLSVLNLRARNLAGAGRPEVAAVTPAGVDVEAVVETEGKSAIVHGAVIEHADPVAAEPEAKPAKKAAPKAKAEGDAPAKKAPAKAKAAKTDEA